MQVRLDRVKWTLNPLTLKTSEPVQVLPGTGIRGKGSVAFNGYHSGSSVLGEAIATVWFHADNWKIHIDRIDIEGTESFITVQLLQSISIRDFTAQILQELSEHVEGFPSEDFSVEELLAEWPKGNISRLLQAVTDTYNLASICGNPPTIAVAEAFHVGRTKAGDMIAEARRRGFPLAQPVPYPGKRKKANAKKETTRRTNRDD